jgi:hypothetical protein
MAVSVACPKPVKASEPYNSTQTLATRARELPSAKTSLANRFAAIIGPTVCELDGPTPTLNKSNTLIISEISKSLVVPMHSCNRLL